MSFLENRFLNRVLHKTLWAALLPLCALWGMAQAVAERSTPHDTSTATQSVELPTEWQGTPLRPLALSEVELRFAKHFPGTLARLTDGRQVLVLRTVNQPTRMLHPATDCYRGLGYRIRNEQLEEQSDKTRWRCFVADRGGRPVRVCERIEDAQGQGFTDASAWYWASAAGQSTGPWKAITVATPL
ncbi:hypothetical protein [Rhodoferax saidenbachensis]|uniref:CNP1-like uncharacterized domain-containing protein n=1 Tax=Rhodoferax saidenbachensis TaxID=1484693 RepID=A0ABU1ZPY1_9BURK|nr:hypothetical protein [Rhodoferax saidenbachensis]MDR7307538.1 hypothetical protein [Rhodoferax saidenbachensis]